jgi:malate dehydrogenase (oxaloacetate-decarboxylating)(NADP+)
MVTKQEVLNYHIGGKTAIEITKPCDTQKDLSLAYTPGVAEPCLEIAKDPILAYKYTNKANLVAVITDSSAVLGLGDLGDVAGKPVMEGKAVLFKKFANIDAFDIELSVSEPEDIISACKAIAPTFGGINLEDIKAPKCFEIEEKLKEILDIPVMHDDQHGTAIITTAAIINALEITNKNIKDLKIVILGAGAAAIACANMYKLLGAENIIMIDSKGVINKSRKDLNKYKAKFATECKCKSLKDAMKDADIFLGLSGANLVTKEMVKSMNEKPIIFALANPTPEIYPQDVYEVKPNAIVATGRSDFPNQVNNVLGFPFIFRGALDVYASHITENMKMAAAIALAKLAKEPVEKNVLKAYNLDFLEFGKDYIIPKPFDKRVLYYVAPAVAKAAIDDGVARIKHFNLEEYVNSLKELSKNL